MMDAEASSANSQEARKTFMVCLGDSITHGDTGQGFNAPHPWPEQVGRMLGINVVNCGHNGASTLDYATYPEWDQARKVLPSAGLVTIGLGTNDIDLEHERDAVGASRVVVRLERLADEALALACADTERAVPVSVLSVPQMAVAGPIMDRFSYDELIDINAAVAMLNAEYLDLCRRRGWTFVDYAIGLNQRRELYGNTIHPNQDGYDLMACLIAPQLATLLAH